MQKLVGLFVFCGLIFGVRAGICAHTRAPESNAQAGVIQVNSAGAGAVERSAGQESPGGQGMPGSRPPVAPGAGPGGMQGGGMPAAARAIFLRGRVVFEDGTAPPDSVIVERICAGKRRPETYTDREGHFSFEVGRNAEMIPDLSMDLRGRTAAGGLTADEERWGEHALEGCELQASLPGYGSSAIDLSGLAGLHNSNAGTIILHRLAEVEGSTISMTSLSAPRAAKKWYEKGVKAAGKKRWEEARASLERAVGGYPEYAAAWCELGRVYAALGNAGEARRCYEQSMAADGKFLKAYLGSSELAMRERNWEELAERTGTLIKLDPIDYPGAYLYNSFAYYNLSKFDAAEKSARAGIKADPGHGLPDLEHILGVILANKHDYAGAAVQFRRYLEHAPESADAESARQQLAEAERAAGSGATKLATDERR